MNIYISQELSADIRFNMIPLNGFKVRLVKYNTNFKPKDFKASSSFVGLSSISDGFSWQTEEGLKVLFELIDDPLAIGADGKKYYNGAVLYYNRILNPSSLPINGLLIDDPEGDLCNGLNGLNLLGVDANFYPWTDKGDGRLANPGTNGRPDENSWLQEGSKLYALWKIFNENSEDPSKLATKTQFFSEMFNQFNNAIIE